MRRAPDRSAAPLVLEPPRDLTGLRALRAARDRVVDAAGVAREDDIAASVAAYVQAMLDAHFTPSSIGFLVYAALDLGTPVPRSAERRARRTRAIEEWSAWASAIVDRTPVTRVRGAGRGA